MARVQTFTDLFVWQKSKNLFELVYADWKASKEVWYRSQILRAVLSISNNIAEGFQRRSRKEFLQFLAVAKGSCGEVKSMLILAQDTGIVKTTHAEQSIRLTEEIGSLLYLLMKSLNETSFQTSEVKEPGISYQSHIDKVVTQDHILLGNYLH